MKTVDPVQRVADLSTDPDNPSADELREIMSTVRRIAVIGISRDPAKAARRVPSYLAAKGYDVIPINPFADRILGKPVYRRLDEIHEAVDMVLIFRPSLEAATCIRVGAARPERPVIWLQEGIRADEAAAEARAAGIQVVQDLCTYKIHRAMQPAGSAAAGR